MIKQGYMCYLFIHHVYAYIHYVSRSMNTEYTTNSIITKQGHKIPTI